ncbi:beta-1,4-N-acetylgalactosaminyltransferase bre-4-like [Ornithodoros turicata]|uniref:beta-1,4-N-acetylgalactosaminyltransferase bre-4-like n=1 Tax=Ornithodoros turicata TaxID=34597 RepID=UPI003138FA39
MSRSVANCPVLCASAEKDEEEEEEEVVVSPPQRTPLHRMTPFSAVSRLLRKKYLTYSMAACITIGFLPFIHFRHKAGTFSNDRLQKGMAQRSACDVFSSFSASHVPMQARDNFKTDGTIGYNVLGQQYVGNQKDYWESPIEATESAEPCPVDVPYLIGVLPILWDVPPTKLELIFSDVQPGGRWMPKHCRARHRVAVVVPYRNRSHHLPVFLHHMHQLLRKQHLDYGIYIVEQLGNGVFNRAKLLNIGFEQALQLYPYDCFIFHDIDLIAETDYNLYTCPDFPRHMSPCVDKTNYRLSYDTLFGGVSAVRREHFVKVNGFSNIYWGWGGEDDDLSSRLRYSKLELHRYNCTIGRYRALVHDQDDPSSSRFTMLQKWDIRQHKDGLNSLKYKVVDIIFRKLYTLFRVDLLHRPPVF